MRAVCWQGTHKVQVDTVPDPEIEDPRDVVLKVTSTAICGSDLHLYDGFIPAMEKGDVLGHEFMGEVVEVGSGVSNLKVGDRIAVPFNIACGNCDFCREDLYSLCDNSNPDHEKLETLYGQAGSGLFGYSHLFGGFAGGQAEYVRVPYADVGHVKIPAHLPDEKVLFLTDIFPTGYQAAENAGIEKGDTVAVWGCGPVGQFAIRSALMLGAGRVVAIDRVPERLRLAEAGGAETIDFSETNVLEALKEMTKGRGPDRCIDAVGLEAHGAGSIDAVYDKIKAMTMLETDRPHVLREAIMACRKGGTVSLPGVYGGLVDKFPIGAAFGKGLTFKMGQTHTHRYMRPLLERVERGEIDPTFIITHRLKLDDAPEAYETFRDKRDGCVKVVMTP